ncbi:MAG: DUF1926 domain-containing protein [Firmicutes bacterium]|nr:DUF1926 domain-containing protein [Bacillota bacterium]
MAKSIYFTLGIHNHQPVGNFESVFEDAYKKSYLPFIELLEAHPAIKISMHYSGPLWDYLLKKHEEWIRKLAALVKRSQVEILTGAYYEPILPNIHDHDKIGQIKLLTRTIEKYTGYKAKGMWTAERVWEPQLAKPMAEGGVKYTILDEAHFRYAGLEPSGIFGYYITEEQGLPLYIFPISYQLRHLIPFKEPEKTLEFLASAATEEGNLIAVFADDGEKFGVWPGTYKTSFEEKWLERFFKMLEENSSWIKLITFSEYMEKHPPAGRIYLPTASYFEMLEWALPAPAGKEFQKVLAEVKAAGKWEEYENFLKGGFWRNFLAKYPEANNMQKKALLVSHKVEKMKGVTKHDALKELWQGQCNCGYWHGVFGGIYLNHIRTAVYEHLIAAERIADNETHSEKPFIHAETIDFDLDGKSEILINSDKINLYLGPHQGGYLFELDYKIKPANLCNSLSRREEIYHKKIRELAGMEEKKDEGLVSIHEMVKSKEKGLEKFLNYDWYRRVSLLDHFFHPSVTLESFRDTLYREQGDFVNQLYQYDLKNDESKAELTLSRNGHVWIDESFVPVRVEKKINLTSGEPAFTVEYKIKNLSENTIKLWFSPEFNFSFLSGNDKNSFYICGGLKTPLDSTAALENIKDFAVKDGIRNIDINLGMEIPCSLWMLPLETISQSEAGFERVYQASTLLPNWKFTLGKNKEWQVKIKIFIQ